MGFRSESAAEKFIHRVIDIVHDKLVSHYVTPFSHAEQIERQWIKVDTAFPEAIAITDTKFQMCYRPKGRFHEARIYFSPKHGAYGIKTEITHARNGRAMMYSNHVHGSKHDYSVFISRVDIHKKYLTKVHTDRTLTDDGALQKQFPLMWAMLCDKGYTGAENHIRAIIPVHSPNANEEQTQNRKIGKARVLCENYYGRMVSLWGIIARKWRWDHKVYDQVMGICLALTNAHIDISPLRAEEYKIYRSLLVEYAELYDQQKQKEQESKQKSRERQQQRLQALNHV